MDTTGRVTRSLRRRLNSVDIDIQASNAEMQREELLTTPSKNSLFNEENGSENPVIDKTPVTRSARRRSIEITSSPVVMGTPLRKTRKSSVTQSDLQSENIDSAKKSFKKSLIPDIVEEDELIGMKNYKVKPRQIIKNLCVKVEKLKKQNEKNKPEHEQKEDNEILKTSQTLISNEDSPSKIIDIKSNETKKGKNKSEKNDLSIQQIYENREIRNLETYAESNKVSVELEQKIMGENNQKINTENNSLLLSSISKEFCTELACDIVDEIPTSQIIKSRYHISSPENNVRGSTEANDLCEENIKNQEESNNFNENVTIKDITANSSDKIDTNEKKISLKFESLSPENFVKTVSSSDQSDEMLSEIEKPLVVENNETDIKMKSVTFSDSELHSEKNNSKFRKTPITNKSKNILNQSINSENNIISGGVGATNPLKIYATSNIDDIPLQKLFENVNISTTSTNGSPNKNEQKTSIASSTPLNTVTNANSKKKADLLQKYPIFNIQENNKISKSWTHSVRGTPEDKIDKFSVSMQEEQIFDKGSISLKEISCREEIKCQNLQCEKDEESNSAEGDLNSFIDNEAVENNEDSLDEEERRYLQENEIEEKGISLGSQDTTDSNSGDSTNDSFINDEEDNVLLSTDPEEYLIESPAKGNPYKEEKTKPQYKVSEKEGQIESENRKQLNFNQDDSFAGNCSMKGLKTHLTFSESQNTDAAVDKLNKSLNNHIALTLNVTKFADQSSSEDEKENSKLSLKINKLSKSCNSSMFEKSMKVLYKEVDFNSKNQIEMENNKQVVESNEEDKEIRSHNNDSELEKEEISENKFATSKFNADNTKEKLSESKDLEEKQYNILHSSYKDKLKCGNEISANKSSRNNEDDLKIEKNLRNNSTILNNVFKNKEENYIHDQIKATYNLNSNHINETEEVGSTRRTNVSNILKRCDEILNAANEAKLRDKIRRQNELKMNTERNINSATSRKIKENVMKNIDKKKIENKKAISKALQHTKALLLSKVSNEDDINKKTLLSPEIIEAISKKETSTENETPNINLKRKFKMDKKNENDIEIKKRKSNSLEKSNLISTSSGLFVEEVIIPKNRNVSKIELPTGTVYEEPLTPVKSKIKSGFTESPVTPLGFKVRHILSAGQKEIPELKLNKKSKRKILNDPVNILPKTVWSSSGEFIEEIYKPIKNKDENVFTEFYAVPLKSKKHKSALLGNEIVNEKAIKFKEKALSLTNNCRETSKQLLQRKERQKIYYK